MMGLQDPRWPLPGEGLDAKEFNDVVHNVICILSEEMKPKARAKARARLEAWAVELEQNERPPNVVPLHGPRPGPEERRYIAGRLARAATIRTLSNRSIF